MALLYNAFRLPFVCYFVRYEKLYKSNLETLFVPFRAS